MVTAGQCPRPFTTWFLSSRCVSRLNDVVNLAWPSLELDATTRVVAMRAWHGGSDGPWKTMETDRGVPYYVHGGSGASGQIHWFHPAMQGALGDLEQLNVIRYAVYRTAAKLLALQKLCCLHLVSVSTILTVFNSSAVDWESELNVRQVYQLLRKVHGMASREQPMPHVDGELASELTLNLLLAICDSERSGKVSPRSMWNALLLLSTGQLTHKYRAVYWAMLHNHQGKRDVAAGVNKSAVRTFLQDTTQLLALLGEGCAFGTAEMAVTSLFHAESVGSITESQFLGWCLSEPQLFLWLPAMYRMMKAAGSIHEAKCNICKTCPIVGLRFRCLRCWNLDLCQNCFLTGRDTGWHAPSHPVIESCTSGGVWSDVRLCLRKMRNIVLGERCRTKEVWRRARLCPSSPLSAGPSQPCDRRGGIGPFSWPLHGPLGRVPPQGGQGPPPEKARLRATPAAGAFRVCRRVGQGGASGRTARNESQTSTHTRAHTAASSARPQSTPQCKGCHRTPLCTANGAPQQREATSGCGGQGEHCVQCSSGQIW
ncbi:dystrotelin isoform X3 [Petromyzon marinus]|uniref:dystrotelin isoform X3 n=1 Tax=Petromyzon marinus TaxID=7757 RepID=UPI003F70D6D2